MSMRKRFEYQVKFKVKTGNFLPPYSFEGLEIYKAYDAKEAIVLAKKDYLNQVGLEIYEEAPLIIESVNLV